MDPAIIFEYVFFAYATLLMIIGPVLNILCAITCFATDLRKYPSFIYIGVIAIADSFALIVLQLKAFLAIAFKLYPFDEYLIGLKIWTWFVNISTETASLVMILMTTERILTMKIKIWRKRYFNSKKAVISVMVVLAYLFCLDVPILINGLTNDTNLTLYARYMNTDLNRIHVQIFTMHFVMIPAPVLIIENAYLIYITLSKSGTVERSKEANKKRRTISLSVVLVTLLFVFLNTPIGIILAFFTFIADPLNSIHSIYLLANALTATFESISFLTLYNFNSLFKNEFLRLFKRNERYVSSTSNVVTTNA